MGTSDCGFAWGFRERLTPFGAAEPVKDAIPTSLVIIDSQSVKLGQKGGGHGLTVTKD